MITITMICSYQVNLIAWHQRYPLESQTTGSSDPNLPSLDNPELKQLESEIFAILAPDSTSQEDCLCRSASGLAMEGAWMMKSTSQGELVWLNLVYVQLQE
jgi:hypothetical protein